MKKIFIIVPEALLIRNILRSGVLAGLKKKATVFLSLLLVGLYRSISKKNFRMRMLPCCRRRKKEYQVGQWHKVFILLTHFLILNDTTRVYFKYNRHYIKKSWWVRAFYIAFLNIISRLFFLKKVIRWLEINIFQEKNHQVVKFFDELKPHLVFSTSITARIDNIFMKEAKRRGIKTVSMTKSWDNATKMYFRFVPDYFIVQNEVVKESLSVLPNFPADKIQVVGFPQFDWYVKDEIFKTRAEHLKSKGLSPDLPVIFFASQGIWYREDCKIAETIYQWNKNNELVKKCQLIVRPHFTNVKNTPLQKLRGLEGVAYDDSYHVSDDFIDSWDPTVPDVIDFANTLKYSDVIVVMLSTIALDASCFDKPVIDTLFGGTYQGQRDVTSKLAKVVHYQWVFRTHGTTAVTTPDDLKKAINNYLLNPERHREGRKRILDELNYKVDGNPSGRIVDFLEKI